jgi:hypothetical protein
MPLLAYDVIFCLVGAVLLERLAAFSASSRLHGSLYAIGAVALVIIYQSISIANIDAFGNFGYAAKTVAAATFFYTGAAFYFIPSLMRFFRTGMNTRWK